MKNKKSIENFIKTYITKRENSLFKNDIDRNHEELSSQLNGKSILVIGGAGTIGSSYIKAILNYKVASLVVVDYSENGLTELTRDLRSSGVRMPEEFLTYPFDFGGPIFEKMFMSRKFDVVACFAAHKHVRSEKDPFAIEAMVRNNVFNTKKLLDLALQNKPAHLFSVSTDKAANPVNVMGASKKLMEEVLLAYSDKIKITTARFANVAFSNGSLLDGWIRRLEKGQPIPAPSDIKRYFVSPEESGQICMLSCLLGKSGDIFFPKLVEDQMMTFSDIAERYLEYQGLKPLKCSSDREAIEIANGTTDNSDEYPVVFFKSDTSGEKLYEEFFTDLDTVDNDSYEGLGVISDVDIMNKSDITEMVEGIDKLFSKSNFTKEEIVHLIGAHIPSFHHIETGKSLDQKM